MKMNDDIIYLHEVQNPRINNKVHFYLDELYTMTERLKQMSLDYDYEDFVDGLDYFHERLIIDKAGIEDLRDAMKKNERALIADILRNPIAISRRKQEYNARQWELLMHFDKQFSELREDFNWFCFNWA
jgi:hypothetical protein